MRTTNPNFTEAKRDGKICLETVCPFCGKKQALELEGDKAIAYEQGKVAYDAGARIQNAWPSFTPDERELILTGICPECWETMR